MRNHPGDIPSALDRFSDIQDRLHDQNPVFFLDYDGTLSPIVSRPEDAVLSEAMREVLRRLAELCTVALVSGRDRADVKNFVQLEELIYAGSHGFDITGPDVQQPEGQAALPELNQAQNTLERELQQIPGAQVERKKYAIAVHYRNVAEEQVERVKRIAENVLAEHSSLKKSGGKMIVELQPDIEWDKGKALLWLLEELDLVDPENLPFYIGDDLTDENAFRELTDRGIGILVGKHGELTYASYSLESVEEVREFLKRIITLLEEKQ